ncbi:MAG: hypothetical protein ACI909_001281 [Planctomycetota bacterium]|jgi:hypothetical protein
MACGRMNSALPEKRRLPVLFPNFRRLVLFRMFDPTRPIVGSNSFDRGVRGHGMWPNEFGPTGKKVVARPFSKLPPFGFIPHV